MLNIGNSISNKSPADKKIHKQKGQKRKIETKKGKKRREKVETVKMGDSEKFR